MQISRSEPSARSQIVKLLRRRKDEHDTVCVRRVLKLRIRNLRVDRLTIEKNDFGRLVTIKDGWCNASRFSGWRDKFFERAPLLVLRDLGHVRRQLLRGRPLAFKAIGSQPLLVNSEIISGIPGVEKQWPLRVNDELQICVWNFRKDRLTIHAQQDRWPVTHKNFGRIVVQLRARRRLLLRRGRNQRMQRD